jgi:hypothetical protein
LLQKQVGGFVRLNYVQSDPYAHDPALSEPPLLSPIDALVSSAPASDEEYELLTLLVRRRNRVLHELSEARRSLREALSVGRDSTPDDEARAE